MCVSAIEYSINIEESYELAVTVAVEPVLSPIQEETCFEESYFVLCSNRGFCIWKPELFKRREHEFRRIIVIEYTIARKLSKFQSYFFGREDNELSPRCSCMSHSGRFQKVGRYVGEGPRSVVRRDTIAQGEAGCYPEGSRRYSRDGR